MRNKYMFFLLLFFLLDIFIGLKFRFNIYEIRSPFWTYHIILFLVYVILNRVLYPLKANLDILPLLFPVLGFFCILVNSIFFQDRDFSHQIEEEADMKTYIADRMRDKRVDAAFELELLSAFDILALGTSKEKKDFLVDLDIDRMPLKVEVLKRALKDKDVEVIHYAATSINKIEENFQKNIRKFERSGDFQPLAKELFDYCQSGLLKDEVLSFYLDKTLEVLDRIKEKKPEEKIMVLEIYREKKEIKKSWELLKEFFPEKGESENKDILEYKKAFVFEESIK